MINMRRGAGVWFAYDLFATSPTGRKFKQGYYEDESRELMVDKETLEKLGYSNVHVIERAWHKNKKRSY